MALTPVSRRSVPDAVFDQLASDILGGELAPGVELPAERRLAEVLGVSRPAVREALQRLAQAGLVDVRQGDATTVRDYRRSAGPELLPRLLAGDGTPDLEVVRHILEARFALMPDIARRAALRRSEDDLARMHELVGRMADEVDDLPTLQRTAHELSSTIVDGSGNVVYRLLFNALEAAYLPAMDALAQVLADELTDVASYRALVDAIDVRNAALAASIGRRLIGIGTQAALAAIDELQAG
ncbi:FadR/GntR family transcriptional regulator [Nitriliruptor alkaliphilus]|uniref:FadR/GntR family transcriptional regulator n=1 Tax=Nitriliruptor alkaliphilus TaxID=427918 RepID=UPI000696F396|nr:GntR family transcriptional regulator [Nitriliruptor alkaliphilus]